MSEQEKSEFKYCVSVKFRGAKKAYSFGTDMEDLKYGDKVVVETIRGVELGERLRDF